MKDEILNIAERQLTGGGYDKLNFGQIATALGTTRANLHYHFKNKETLAIAVMERFAEQQIAGLEALRAQFDGDFHGFVAALDNGFWVAGSDGSANCIAMATDPDLPETLRSMTVGFYDQVGRSLRKTVEAAQVDGSIRADLNATREAARGHVLIMGIMTALLHMPDMDTAKAQLSGLLIDWAESLR